jgi:hypothetical protein
VIEIPSYPNGTILFSQSMSAAGGGGGMAQNEVTADPTEVVVAFFEERLGPAQRDAASGSAVWHFPESDGGLRGGRHLEVWPVDGAYPFRDDEGSYPQPPDARTVIHYSYLYVPAEADPESGPPPI